MRKRLPRILGVLVILALIGMILWFALRPRIYCGPNSERTGIEFKTRNITVTDMYFDLNSGVFGDPVQTDKKTFVTAIEDPEGGGDILTIEFRDRWGNDAFIKVEIQLSIYEDYHDFPIVSMSYRFWPGDTENPKILSIDPPTFVPALERP